MKKMLSILTALALGSTGAASVVACGTNETVLENLPTEKFGEVLSQLADKEEGQGLVFEIKVGTEKGSDEFWSQIHAQLDKYLATLNYEVKGQYDLKFGESPNQNQLNEVGFEWHSGKINQETGEREFTDKSSITIYVTNDKGVVLSEGTASNLHWVIKIVE